MEPLLGICYKGEPPMGRILWKKPCASPRDYFYSNYFSFCLLLKCLSVKYVDLNIVLLIMFPACGTIIPSILYQTFALILGRLQNELCFLLTIFDSAHLLYCRMAFSKAKLMKKIRFFSIISFNLLSSSFS